MDAASVLVISITFLVTLYVLSGKKNGTSPPDPWCWPLIGVLSITYKNKRFHLTLHKWAQRYGSIYRIKLGAHDAVVLNSYAAIKEAVLEKTDFFVQRPSFLDYIQKVNKEKGIFFNNGESWKEIRRMMLVSLRDLGVGKSHLERKIQDQANLVVTEMRRNDGKAACLQKIYFRLAFNMVVDMLFGNSYDGADDDFDQIFNAIRQTFSGGGLRNVFVYLPKWTFFLIPYIKPNSHREFIVKMLTKQMDGHKKNIQNNSPDENNNDKCFMDLFLEAQKKRGTRIFSDENKVQLVRDMYIAGIETTSSTLTWMVYYMIKHPEIQQQCREEIHKVFGAEGDIYYKDREQTPYLEATICEVQRMSSLVAYLQLSANTDATLCGYKIARGTLVFPNLYSLNRDPNLWEEPNTFNPGRFLDEQGKLKKVKAFIPFGLGKRQCAGEILARVEVYVAAATVLQRLTLRAKDVKELPSEADACGGITINLPDFDVLAENLIA